MKNYSKFLLHSGLRVDEGINSFNKVIELNRERKLGQYYDESLNCLCHFKYPETFIRKTKNCFITFTSPEFLNQIVASETITYASIRERLERNKIGIGFNELEITLEPTLYSMESWSRNKIWSVEEFQFQSLSATIGVPNSRNFQTKS